MEKTASNTNAALYQKLSCIEAFGQNYFENIISKNYIKNVPQDNPGPLDYIEIRKVKCVPLN